MLIYYNKMTDVNFYTELEGGKLITDPLVAEYIARIEAKLGPEKAQLAENHLYESGGFNLGQEKRVLLMNELDEQFPDAFKILIDSNGRKFLLSKQASEEDFDAITDRGEFNPFTRIFLSAEGFGFIRSNVNLLSKRGREKGLQDLQLMKTVDFTPLLDKLSETFRLTGNEQLTLKTIPQGTEKKGERVDLFFLEWDILNSDDQSNPLKSIAFKQLAHLQKTWQDPEPIKP